MSHTSEKLVGSADQLHTFTCDDCGEEQEFEGSFATSWGNLKAEGWRCWKDGDEFTHICPDCMEARKEEMW